MDVGPIRTTPSQPDIGPLGSSAEGGHPVALDEPHRLPEQPARPPRGRDLRLPKVVTSA
ncbi:hypothetical protein Rumeso_04280 [Rubellimicrobium mesophilum DSM 19309]|uniref:Uncharacterized protein n=1 Tax=Rubellimicrobium mesophilum DSM 19309 TaxID=442562 RepID=A0A017HJ90_9RHOB|nr:hypothetical protein Rumeso_04280 [Rubellimicrobium mesophilum DSM 19309]